MTMIGYYERTPGLDPSSDVYKRQSIQYLKAQEKAAPLRLLPKVLFRQSAPVQALMSTRVQALTEINRIYVVFIRLLGPREVVNIGLTCSTGAAFFVNNIHVWNLKMTQIKKMDPSFKPVKSLSARENIINHLVHNPRMEREAQVFSTFSSIDLTVMLSVNKLDKSSYVGVNKLDKSAHALDLPDVSRGMYEKALIAQKKATPTVPTLSRVVLFGKVSDKIPDLFMAFLGHREIVCLGLTCKDRRVQILDSYLVWTALMWDLRKVDRSFIQDRSLSAKENVKRYVVGKKNKT